MRHARNEFDFFIFVTSARELCAGAVLSECSDVKPVCVLCVYICGLTVIENVQYVWMVVCLFVLALQQIGGLSLVYSSSHPFTVAGVCFPCLRHPDVAAIVHVGAAARMTLSLSTGHSYYLSTSAALIWLLWWREWTEREGRRRWRKKEEGG